MKKNQHYEFKTPEQLCDEIKSVIVFHIHRNQRHAILNNRFIGQFISILRSSDLIYPNIKYHFIWFFKENINFVIIQIFDFHNYLLMKDIFIEEQNNINKADIYESKVSISSKFINCDIYYSFSEIILSILSQLLISTCKIPNNNFYINFLTIINQFIYTVPEFVDSYKQILLNYIYISESLTLGIYLKQASIMSLSYLIYPFNIDLYLEFSNKNLSFETFINDTFNNNSLDIKTQFDFTQTIFNICVTNVFETINFIIHHKNNSEFISGEQYQCYTKDKILICISYYMIFIYISDYYDDIIEFLNEEESMRTFIDASTKFFEEIDDDSIVKNNKEFNNSGDLQEIIENFKNIVINIGIDLDNSYFSQFV